MKTTGCANDTSSATRRTGRVDCNRDAPAGLQRMVRRVVATMIIVATTRLTMRCNPAGASRLQSTRPVRRVAELVSLAHPVVFMNADLKCPQCGAGMEEGFVADEGYNKR